MQNIGIVAATDCDWAAAQAKPNEGRNLRTKLARQGVPFFIPSEEIRRTYTRSNGKSYPKTISRSLYPGYCFIPVSAIDEAWETTNLSRVRVDSWEGRMRRELIAIEAEMGWRKFFDADMKVGRMIRVAFGPLEGIRGEVSGVRRDRVQFYVTILGRPAEMEMDIGDLELAS